MKVVLIGKLEQVHINGDDNIHITISKERKDLVEDLYKKLTKLEGRVVFLRFEEVAHTGI